MEAYAILAIVGLGTIFSRNKNRGGDTGPAGIFGTRRHARAPGAEHLPDMPQACEGHRRPRTGSRKTGELLDYQGYEPEFTTEDAMEEETRHAHRMARAARFTEDSGVVDPRTRRLYTGEQPEKYYSELAGHDMDADDFVHGNMRPQYAKNTYKHSARESEGLLEMFGTKEGPGNYMHKREVENMFDPVLGASYPNGSPSFTEAFSDRLEAPSARNNDLPFEQVRVGPGVGQGYTATPAGGFTQPQDRDYVMPKTVDELRPLSNQKTVMEGRVIPGAAEQQRGLDPVFAKNRPDTVFDIGDRGLVPTGAPLDGMALRPDVAHAQPTDTIPTKPYTSPAGIDAAGESRFGAWTAMDSGGGQERTLPGGQLPHHPAVAPVPLPLSHQRGLDQSGRALPNERTAGGGDSWEDTYFGAANAPVEYLYPAPERGGGVRLGGREMMADSKRTMGNTLSPQMPGQGPAFDLGEPIRTTMRETQIHDSRSGSVMGGIMPYADAFDPDCRATIREHIPATTNAVNRSVPVERVQSRSDQCPPRTTGRELGRPDKPPPLGAANTEHLAGTGAYATAPVPEVFATNRDASLSQYTGGRGGGPGPELGAYAAFQVAAERSLEPTQRESLHVPRTGAPGNSQATKPFSYESLYNATVNDVREQVSRERFSAPQGPSSVNSAASLGGSREPMQGFDTRGRREHGSAPNPSHGAHSGANSTMRDRAALPDNDRLDNDLLDFLKTNPFVVGPQAPTPGPTQIDDPQRNPVT